MTDGEMRDGRIGPPLHGIPIHACERAPADWAALVPFNEPCPWCGEVAQPDVDP